MSRRIVELAERARAARPDIENLKPAERRIVIQMILMDEPDADPDNVSLLKAHAEAGNFSGILERGAFKRPFSCFSAEPTNE